MDVNHPSNPSQTLKTQVYTCNPPSTCIGQILCPSFCRPHKPYSRGKPQQRNGCTFELHFTGRDRGNKSKLVTPEQTWLNSFKSMHSVCIPVERRKLQLGRHLVLMMRSCGGTVPRSRQLMPHANAETYQSSHVTWKICKK